MKIFFTGHKGSIGAILTEKLMKDHTVCGFDIKDGKDMTIEENLFNALQASEADVVIHCAAIPSPKGKNSIPSFEKFWITNVIGTKNVVLSALKLKIKKLVYFSSGSVYGWDDYPEGEIEQYATSKRIAEEIVRWGAGQGICSSILRLAPVGAGPSEQFFFATVAHDAIHKFVLEAINNTKWLSIYNVSESEHLGKVPSWKVGEISDEFIKCSNYSSIN